MNPISSMSTELSGALGGEESPPPYPRLLAADPMGMPSYGSVMHVWHAEQDVRLDGRHIDPLRSLRRG